MRMIDLLRHTSGLGYGWGSNTYVDRKYKKADIWESKDTKDFINKISKIPLYHEPGTGWRYGVSTDVCGYLVEVLSGQSLDEFLSSRIFMPLNMVDTHFQVPDNKINRFTTNYINNIPEKYRWLLRKSFNPDGKLMAIDNPDSSEFTKNVTFFSGGGGLVSTTKDYVQFCKMILNQGELNGARILGPKTIELMTEDHLKFIPHKGGPLSLPNNGTSFGLGFSVVKNTAAKEVVGSVGTHGWGGAAGTFFGIDPEEDLIFVLMIQLIDFDNLKISERFQAMVYQSIVE
jgi:CubicO group peptidase (beta-lactamase class C family)